MTDRLCGLDYGELIIRRCFIVTPHSIYSLSERIHFAGSSSDAKHVSISNWYLSVAMVVCVDQNVILLMWALLEFAIGSRILFLFYKINCLRKVFAKVNPLLVCMKISFLDYVYVCACVMFGADLSSPNYDC